MWLWSGIDAAVIEHRRNCHPSRKTAHLFALFGSPGEVAIKRSLILQRKVQIDFRRCALTFWCHLAWTPESRHPTLGVQPRGSIEGALLLLSHQGWAPSHSYEPQQKLTNPSPTAQFDFITRSISKRISKWVISGKATAYTSQTQTCGRPNCTSCQRRSKGNKRQHWPQAWCCHGELPSPNATRIQPLALTGVFTVRAANLWLQGLESVIYLCAGARGNSPFIFHCPPRRILSLGGSLYKNAHVYAGRLPWWKEVATSYTVFVYIWR